MVEPRKFIRNHIVCVQRDGKKYRCIESPGSYKCGRCSHGLIDMKPGYVCKVCGAVVMSIFEKPRGRFGGLEALDG